ncbi:host specificity factor TipJ family phage tail protein [Rhodopseudomonas palustris]|uniref:host specificity factor TipJ family phage tail protein n=1 Tax=Rhodopseudomonas palustris TaxID=1076 RepID=UPI0022F0E5D5|nr:host specificity factor TipJ family phage tail protein [Rhodopseudomonas palustris]WBU27597.1 host specificity factor TipJ family phage tail protein [Rhodopseudomonas palustris]
MTNNLTKLPAALPPAERSRARRNRASGARRPVLHVVMPGVEVARAVPRPRESIAAFLRRTGWAVRDRQGWRFRKGLPTICEINGAPLLRRDWSRRRISARDHVRFVSAPLQGGQGGGSTVKQVIGLVALVAVAAFAAWAGPALVAGMGLTGTAATLAGGLATGIIGLGGALLVNSLVAPKAGATNKPSATQDQIYSVLAQGNAARLGEPLPVWYGRLKEFPDFAATPWGEFVGNDQYLNVLLSVSMGSMAYEALYVDDTLLWTAGGGLVDSFAGTEIAFYEPGQTVTLFPKNVHSSSEVTGQQLPDGSGTKGGSYVDATGTTPGAWVGGYVANPSGTQAMALAIDYVLPAGCFTVNSEDGGIGTAAVSLTAEYAAVNEAGAQISGFIPLAFVEKSFATQSPIRDTVKVTVGPGRYMVRLRRNDAALSGTSGSNSVLWAGLRAFMVGDSSFADVSTVAIRIPANKTTQGSYRFGVLATRKLPVWAGSAFATQPTRNPFWAQLDMAVNATYGAELAESKIDYNAIIAQAAAADARGDTFDYRFATAVPVPEAFDKALTVARSRHFWLGDTVSVVRDEWRDVPTMLLTDREIVRDSMQISFKMLGDEDPDAVVIEYKDQDTWLPAQVQYPPDDELFTATRAEPRRLDGIVNRAQAYREAAFYYLQSIYRRENVQIGTEYEGRAITFGSVVRVQSDLPMAYGHAGAVIDRSGLTLTLDPAPSWADAGNHYIRIRRPNGKLFGPVRAVQGANASLAVLDGAGLAAAEAAQSVTLADVLARSDGAEWPSYELGTADNQSRLCVVLGGVPDGDHCTLSLVVDDPRVHAAADAIGSPPVLPVGQFPSNPQLPLIIGLNARIPQGVAEPKLAASWFPTEGALYYVADISLDGGEHWQQVYEGQANQFEAVVPLAALKLRVQAVSTAARGPYATVDLVAPTIQIANNAVALESIIEGLRYQVTKALDDVQTTKNEMEQLIASIASNDMARNWLDKKQTRAELSAQAGGAKAAIAEVRAVAVDTQESLAAYQVTVSATFGNVTSMINQESLARSQADEAMAGQITTVSTQVGANSASISTIQTSVNGIKVQYGVLGTINGSTGGFTLEGIGQLDGTASWTINIRGDVIADGSITAPKMSVGALSAITVNAGDITAGTLRSPAGEMIISLNNARIEIYG